MNLNSIAGKSSDSYTKHSITHVYYNHLVSLPRLCSEVLNHTGICAFFGPIISRSRVASACSGLVLGGAYSIIIPAAKSSARVSIISFKISIKRFLNIAIRLSRLSLNSASRSRLQDAKYFMSRRSRSSAVSGMGMGCLRKRIVNRSIKSIQQYESTNRVALWA